MLLLLVSLNLAITVGLCVYVVWYHHFRPTIEVDAPDPPTPWAIGTPPQTEMDEHGKALADLFERHPQLEQLYNRAKRMPDARVEGVGLPDSEPWQPHPPPRK